MKAKWAIGAIAVAASFLAGYIAKDFLDFRSEQRKLIVATLEQAARSSGELTPVLEKFSRAARGDGTVLESDRQDLQRLLAAALASARISAQLVPELRDAYESYVAASAELQQAVDKMRGGLNVNRLLSAISRYQDSADRLNREAANAQRSYLRYLVRS